VAAGRITPGRAAARLVGSIAAALASAAFTGLVFFAALAAWGSFAAPFVRLESASFVIVCALAVSVTTTVAVWRTLYRRYRKSLIP
jgi:hypothetical protein